MNNRYRLKINLHALKNAFVSTIKGKETTRRCVCIPIEDNHLFVGSEEKGKPVYLDMVAFAMKEPRDWATHVVKQSLKERSWTRSRVRAARCLSSATCSPTGT
jgi:hypothetical protein